MKADKDEVIQNLREVLGEDGHGTDGGHERNGGHRADGSYTCPCERSVAELKQQKEKLEQERNAVAERYNTVMLRGGQGSSTQARAAQSITTSATQSMQTTAAETDHTTTQSHADTQNHSETLNRLYAEYERLDAEIGTLEHMIQEKEMRERKIQAFLEALELPGEEFSESAWCMMVDRVTVLPGKLVFLLANGEEVEV